MDTMETVDNMQQNTGRKFHPKIVYVILGIVLLAESAWGLHLLLSPATYPATTVKAQALKDGTISVTAKNKEYNIGSAVLVSIKIDTGGHQTAGSDVILHFDPKVLEATSAAITKGKLYSNYSKLEIDPKGLVTVSGISLVNGANYSGNGVLALIGFKAKAAGQTKLSVDFTAGSTKDSNIIDSMTGQDILGSVSNLDLTIK